jgi:hypothetical protein
MRPRSTMHSAVRQSSRSARNPRRKRGETLHHRKPADLDKLPQGLPARRVFIKPDNNIICRITRVRPRYTMLAALLIGTPCDFSAIASGATINAACILFGISASFDFRKALKQPRQENFARFRKLRNVIRHLTRQMARHRNERDLELSLRLRHVIVQDRRPVHIQLSVQPKAIGSTRLSSLLPETPSYGFKFLQPPERKIQTKSDRPDHQHRRHHKVIALA